jgi:beta-glucuronidase
MLRPIDSATRETKSLDGLWRFALDSSDLSAPWSAPLPGDLECPVPASYNDIFVQSPSLRNHVGKVWYQRTFRVPRGWAGQHVYLRVDAATHEGEVYIGDKLVATHVGGYTPFEADLSEIVKPGVEVRVTIGVDNTLTNQTIPPGELKTDDAGHTKQKYWHDFFNYAGLARSVRLCSVPKTRVQDVTVKTDVEGKVGKVAYEVTTQGEHNKIQIDLLDTKGAVAASATTVSGTLSVPNANLWQPGAAYLYTLRARLTSSNSEVIDEYTLPVGIRSIRVKGIEFLINDKPFYFRGFGRHEDTPVKGKGHDDSWMVHDFELMKWTGANSFRTSHYPYAEEVLDYADRHGWVVVDETAAVGINLSIESGILGGVKRKTFSPDFAGDKMQEAHRQAIKELIARDKNHPSVVMWSITNEPASQEEGAREYFEPLVKLTKELDPTRPVTFANVLLAPVDKCRIADLFDVIGLNRYYGWYVGTGDLVTAARELEEELHKWAEKYKRPLIIFEYGADTVAGVHDVDATPWSEEFQSQFLETYHRAFDKVDAVVGEHVWNFADFATGPGFFRVDGNKKGVFTRDRRPKASAHTLRKRWHGKE